MKRIAYLIVVCFLISSVSIWSQETSDQKEKREEAERKAAEAQKKIEEMLKKNPEMKKMMEEAIAAEEAAKKRAKNKKKITKGKPFKNTKKNTDYLNRYLITDSSKKMFKNWPHGIADLYLVSIGWNSSTNIEHKVGTISADGSFTLTLPKQTVPDKELSYYFGCTVPYSGDKTSYVNPNNKIIRTYVAVRKGEKEIGQLSLATSREQMADHTLMDDYHSLPGYTLQWWYADREGSAVAKCKKSKNEQEDMYINYDLKFKPGWNLVKTEFNGDRFTTAYGRSYFKIQKHKVISNLPPDVKWVYH